MAHATRACAYCEQPFSGDTRRRYCGEACKSAAGRKRAAEWYAEHRDDPVLKVRVREATTRHYAKVKEDPERWRRRLAVTASWREGNAEAIRATERAYWQANRDRKRAKDHRRRARLLDAYVEDVSLAVLYVRDGGFCGICQGPVDLHTPWPNKLAATIDHVVPLARGGEHSYENAQLAHMSCNARKGDRLA